MSDWGDWVRKRKIVTFWSKESNTPEVVLARALEKAVAGHVQAVVIGIVWSNDGSIGTDSSYMTLEDRMLSARAIQVRADDFLRDAVVEE